ncbi:hypothetical protein F4692_003836 [Nocardioides cavernae]|uniref:Uncharacterized protein n=1 Tax=Nocardioides cavernae TaxID=1921566 RepID=A0A7Y9H6Q6_9ACTN|nr:hypothetical protein [Nocardioides cavernae]NYE38686.1 hypothetical protein [Nocardioides cavernae]
MPAVDDWERYLDARWHDLVGALEDDGVPADDARLVVAETLLASRRSWERRVRDEQVDVALWAEVRERAGLAVRPGEAAPHAVRPRDPADAPDAWLSRARRLRSGRRQRGLRRGVAGLAVAALLVTGWAWWAARPEPYAVRAETNPLPVTWYAQGELHLDGVVVAIPDVESFVAWDSGAAARLRSGEVVRVDGDGDVHDTDDPPDTLDDPPAAPPFVALGDYDVLVQSVAIPGGGWAHLLDSSRRDGAQDAVRQSESGRRALVVCTAEPRCGQPETITAADGSIRLR